MALHAYHVPLAVLVAWWMSPTPHSPRSVRGCYILDHAICCKVGRRGIGAGRCPRGPVGRLSLPATKNSSPFRPVIWCSGTHWAASMAQSTPRTCTGVTSGTLPPRSPLPPSQRLVLFTSTAANTLLRRRHVLRQHLVLSGAQHVARPDLADGNDAVDVGRVPYWGVEAESDGAVLWRLHPRETHKSACSRASRKRTAWAARLGWIRGEITSSGTRLTRGRAPFLPEGTEGTSPLLHRRRRKGLPHLRGRRFHRWVVPASAVGAGPPYHGLRTDAGYHQACFDVGDGPSLTELQFEWDRDEPDRWLNPLGLSGRDTVLLDRTGVKFHWFTWLTAN